MKKSGFSLAEVIVTAFIILIGFLAVAKMLPGSHRQGTVSKDRLIALRLARNVIDKVRSMPFPAAGANTPVPSLQGPVSLMGESLEGKDIGLEFAVENVTTTVPAKGASLTEPGFGTVSVTITWHQGVGNANAAGNSSLTMTGGLTREP